MKKFDALFIQILKYGTLINTLALVLIVCGQIYARYFLVNAPSWTEELSRMVFIYAISFASGLSYRQGYFIRLDIWQSGSSAQSNRIFDAVSACATLVLFAFVLVYGIRFFLMGFAERSPGLAIPMAWSFGALTLLGFSMTYFAIRSVMILFRH